MASTLVYLQENTQRSSDAAYLYSSVMHQKDLISGLLSFRNSKSIKQIKYSKVFVNKKKFPPFPIKILRSNCSHVFEQIFVNK